MDASANAALRMALSYSRDGLIAELQARGMQLQNEISPFSEREWARLVRVHFHHVTSNLRVGSLMPMLRSALPKECPSSSWRSSRMLAGG